mgnify:CR=1 FL=1
MTAKKPAKRARKSLTPPRDSLWVSKDGKRLSPVIVLGEALMTNSEDDVDSARMGIAYKASRFDIIMFATVPWFRRNFIPLETP